jgi:hypothetical protein
VTPEIFLRTAVDPALALLPDTMRSTEARAMLVAIALQESKLLHRRQFAGPARSYLQFELTGIEGVLTHEQTWVYARAACLDVDVLPTPPGVYMAIEYLDTLACVFARLLLWTEPRPLPGKADEDDAWKQYLALWRPGKPRPQAWAPNFIEAWHAVQLPPFPQGPLIPPADRARLGVETPTKGHPK